MKEPVIVVNKPGNFLEIEFQFEETLSPTTTTASTSTATTTQTPTSTTTPTATNTGTVTNTPTPTATSSGTLIFADGFESDDFSAWDSSTTDGGDLSVTMGAAMVGTYGMSAVIDDNNAIYVIDETPNGETEYSIRFYFDPNSISMSNNDNHTIFFAYKGTVQPAMRVELRYYSGNYQVRAQARKDSLFVNTSYYTISDDEHYIEVAWSAATSPGANNGELTLYVDGIQKESITNIDNDTIYIDRVQFGAVTEVDNGTRGTYYFDAFESRSSGYIGPVAALPGNSVAQVVPADNALASISYWLLNLLQEIFEWVVTFFQPGSALANAIQVESKTVMSMVMLVESIPSGQVWKTYYYAGSQRVAMRVQDGEMDEVFYLFSDHLGSTSITTDSEGNLYGEMRYTAWGEMRYTSGQTPTDYTYTGQQSEVSSFGLMYYNARWYEPALGRFAEGDTIVPEPGNPLTWDRFAYSFNNPISYIDPSGHVPWFIAGWNDSYMQKQTGNTCAVVSMAVAVSIVEGRKYTEKDVMEWYPQTKPGTDLGVPAFQQALIADSVPGIDAKYSSQGTRNDLMNNLKSGIPTVVSFALPVDVIKREGGGHAIVVIGHDPATGEFVFFNPATNSKQSETDLVNHYNKLPGVNYSDFDDLWAASNLFIWGNDMVSVHKSNDKVLGIPSIGSGGNQTHIAKFR